MPIDARNPFQGEDPIEMLRAITMAFMVLVSRQPHMLVEFDRETLAEFPFECFRLSAMQDPESGAFTFMLIPDKDCEVQQ